MTHPQRESSGRTWEGKGTPAWSLAEIPSGGTGAGSKTGCPGQAECMTEYTAGGNRARTSAHVSGPCSVHIHPQTAILTTKEHMYSVSKVFLLIKFFFYHLVC